MLFFKLFNRMCTHMLLNLLKLITHLNRLSDDKNSDLTDLAWKILKYTVLSK
jgi:hypothetical protein